MKKVVSLTLCICIMCTMSVSASSTMKNKLNDIKNKSSNVNKDIKEKKTEVIAINERLAEIETRITESENRLIEMEEQIAAYTESINKAEDDIKELREKIDVNTELLGKRINVMYKKGDIAYIEILLNSSSFSELLSNINIITKIVSYDKQLLSELQSVKETIEVRKKEMEVSKESLAKIKALVELEKSKLEESEKEQEASKALISSDIKKLQIQEDEFLKEAKALEAKIKELTAKSSFSPTYNGGVMGWPLAVQGKITSLFGYRRHPITGAGNTHTGLDIAAPKGTNVLAASDGVVIASGYAGSYGNRVMIDHGGGIVTLYGHNSALVVQKGAKVKRGTVIAKVGTTGSSTGNHLHFEVRVNGKFVDPRKYL
ncbi:MAG: murein hydrolase activator EnvC family protein [Filifactoraceae bacterium]